MKLNVSKHKLQLPVPLRPQGDQVRVRIDYKKKKIRWWDAANREEVAHVNRPGSDLEAKIVKAFIKAVDAKLAKGEQLNLRSSTILLGPAYIAAQQLAGVGQQQLREEVEEARKAEGEVDDELDLSTWQQYAFGRSHAERVEEEAQEADPFDGGAQAGAISRPTRATQAYSDCKAEVAEVAEVSSSEAGNTIRVGQAAVDEVGRGLRSSALGRIYATRAGSFALTTAGSRRATLLWSLRKPRQVTPRKPRQATPLKSPWPPIPLAIAQTLKSPSGKL